MGAASARVRALALLALAAGSIAILAAGCGSDDESADAESGAGTTSFPQTTEPVDLDPADFTTEITNPYWPMKVGSTWRLRVIEGKTVQDQVIAVTERTKMIANGVEARVVRDVVREDGELVEVTDDWFAQDSAGNVWYFGEETAEYENGKVKTTHGSFEAGVDGADAGIAMPAEPRAGQAYRQEYYAGKAEDRTKVLSTDEQAEVPFGHFDDAILTEDYSPIEPDFLEYKLYARGVGPVLAVTVSGGSAREELLSYTR
jgi:hypothetical protein